MGTSKNRRPSLAQAVGREARWPGEDLAEQFASLTGFHEHAFWTFVERPKYWQGALAFHHVDTVPVSYWRKRKNVPRKPASVDALSIRQLRLRAGERGMGGQGIQPPRITRPSRSFTTISAGLPSVSVG